MKRSRYRFCAMVVAFFGLLALTGCLHREDDNLSERPWNSPKTWESGIPQAMQQGR